MGGKHHCGWSNVSLQICPGASTCLGVIIFPGQLSRSTGVQPSDKACLQLCHYQVVPPRAMCLNREHSTAPCMPSTYWCSTGSLSISLTLLTIWKYFERGPKQGLVSASSGNSTVQKCISELALICCNARAQTPPDP